MKCIFKAKKRLLIGCCLLVSYFSYGQEELPYKPLSLENLGAFKSPSANWQIVGNTLCDKNKEKAIKLIPGKGVLVNNFSGKAKSDLFTAWEHGDLDLEFDFMMAKNSNSGIYFQGRYEIQLLDSWGIKNPTFTDCGGIYQRWDESKQDSDKGYEGYAPLMNVARAPGLWQNMKIEFQAPKFNAKGEKVSNAKFLKVVLNGVTIQENIELSGPTRGAVAKDEKAMAPLRIQGDHGPVAFKNIRYKIYDKEKLKLDDLSYKYFEGKLENNDYSKLAELKLIREGKTKELTWEVMESQDLFALEFSGDLNIIESGDYLFKVVNAGNLKLVVDGKTLINRVSWALDHSEVAKVNLKAGKQSVKLYYSKNASWAKPSLGVYLEGPGVRLYKLHSPGALILTHPEDPVYINPTTEPLLQRTFVDFNGKRKTHAIAVGEPSKINYSMDLNNGSLLQIWKGGFYDASPMWRARGGEAMLPLGSVINLNAAPLVAVLENKNAAWPDSLKPTDKYTFKNYQLDNNGRPTFKYELNNLLVEDKIEPGEDGKYLTRQVKINNIQNTSNQWVRLAEGEKITLLSDGSFAINDHQYYINVLESGGSKPIVREINNKQEILIPVSKPKKSESFTVKYSIVW